MILLKTLTNFEITLNKNSNLTLVALLKKGWSNTRKLYFDFKGENSILNFIGIIVAKNNDSFSFETVSSHKIPNTKSFYDIHGVSFDKSTVDYKGKIIITKKAQHTDAHLDHHSLIFSKEAKIFTLPSLEIEANNVHAGHAATIGKINEDEIFYMGSRGIPQALAKNLLTESFLKAGLSKIKDQKIKQFVIDQLKSIK